MFIGSATVGGYTQAEFGAGNFVRGGCDRTRQALRVAGGGVRLRSAHEHIKKSSAVTVIRYSGVGACIVTGPAVATVESE